MKPAHGTIARYRNYSCRCAKCRAAQAKAAREWRLKVREA